MACFGAVVRNEEGNVLLAAWRTRANVASAEEAEALACLEGIRLAVEWARLPTEVETNCATLVKAVNGIGTSRARWSGHIEEIKGSSRMLSACKVAHVGRDANQVAHDLAQLAKKKRQCMAMHGNVPLEIRALVDCDR
jgi:ribonuclease HI